MAKLTKAKLEARQRASVDSKRDELKRSFQIVIGVFVAVCVALFAAREIFH